MTIFDGDIDKEMTMDKIDGASVDQIIEAPPSGKGPMQTAVSHVVKRKWKIAALVLIFIVAASWTLIAKGYLIIRDQKNTIDKRLACPVCADKKCEICPICPASNTDASANTNTDSSLGASRRTTTKNASPASESTEDVLTPPAPPAD